MAQEDLVRSVSWPKDQVRVELATRPKTKFSRATPPNFCRLLHACVSLFSGNAKAQSTISPSYRIENLSAVCNGNDGSVKVTWSLNPPDILTNYFISYRKQFEPTSCSRLSLLQSYQLTREHIEPLNVYEIKVWPSNCEAAASSVTVYIGKLFVH